MRFVVLVCFTALLFFNSCSKDETPANTNTDGNNNNNNSNLLVSAVLNGGGYTNQTYTIEKGSTPPASYYELSTNTTSIVIVSGDRTVSVVFPGKSVGTYNFSSTASSAPAYVTLGFTNTHVLAAKPGSGTITVTAYGNVNSEVKGTFSGTFYDSSNGNEVTVSNGTFTATRNKDLE